MDARFWTWMAILVLAVSSDTALSDPISVVLVAEDDDTIAKTAIRFGIERDQGAAEPKFKVDVVGFDATVKTEADICKKIFVEGRTPHLVIDATKEYNGTKPTFAKRSQMLKSLLRKMGAPTVSLTATLYAYPGPPLTDAEKEYILSFIPPDLLLSNVAKSVADVIGTQKIGIVYDQTFPFTNKVGLLFDNIPSAIAMIPLSSDIKDTVRQIEVSDLGNIFVFASEKNLNALLRLISRKELVNKHYAWYTISKDSSDVKSTVVNEFSVLHFKPKVLHSDMEKALESYASDAKVDSGFYHDLAAIFREYLLENVGKEGSWPATLTYPECADEMVLTEEMVAERSAIKMRSAIEARESSKGLKGTFGDFVLKSTHPRRTYGFQNIKMEVDKVTLTTKEPVLKSELFWQFQADKKPSTLFSGPTDALTSHKGATILQITAIEEPPFMYKTMVDGKVKWAGYCVDLIEMLKKEANLTFEYRITENKEKVHGEMTENRNRVITWTGLIGDIVEGRAELALGPIAVMAERELFVDFTVPFYDMMGISILMKRFETEKNPFVFLYVMEHDVWYSILAAYLFTSLVMFVFDRLNLYIVRKKRKKLQDEEETPIDFNFKESFWYCFASLTPQTGGNYPRHLSGRLAAASWWLFGFIITASFMANFSAYLTVGRLDRTIASLEDLEKQSKVKYSTVYGSLAYTYFHRMASLEERFYEIWRNMSQDDSLNVTDKAKLAVWDYPITDKFTRLWWAMTKTAKIYPTLEKGIEKTQNSTKDAGHALLAEAFKVEYATMLHCDLRRVGREMNRKPLALALRKGSPLKEPLSNAILKLMNERILEKLKYKWWNENPFAKKCHHYVKRNDGIELDNFVGIFYILGGGVAFALVTLIIEFIYFKCMIANYTRVIKVKDISEPSYGATDRRVQR